MQTHIETRHGRLAIETRGSGTPFVLLHAGGHDRHDFDAIVPMLATRFQTVAIDVLGHGASAHLADPSETTAEKICEAVEDAVVGLRLRAALVAGNSVGGMAALHLAAHRPETVRGLVLVSPSGMVDRNVIVRAFCWLQGREWIRRHAGMAFARSYLKIRNAETDALLARMRERRLDPRFIAMEAALWRSFGESSSDYAARARAIDVPTALVWGRRDPVLRARVEGRRARALMPHASWIELDAGHVPFVETPAAFLAAIEPFLVSVARDAPGAATGVPA